MMAKDKHFVDTSVLRPLQSSSSAYKSYLTSNLSEVKYISCYVQKEFTMGLIVPMMNFYFTLRMQHINNISDALCVWSNKFNPREVKAITSMMSGLLNAHQFDFNDLKQKDNASIIVADYIYKCVRLLPKRYKLIGTDNDLCIKSKHTLDYDLDDLNALFIEFVIKYKNNEDAKSCNLPNFVTANSTAINKIKKEVEKLKTSEKDEYDKWKKILDGLERHTCPKCAKAGDTIISIQSPSNMTIAHTDASFDFLIPPQQKKNIKLKSELSVIKELNEKSKKEKAVPDKE